MARDHDSSVLPAYQRSLQPGGDRLGRRRSNTASLGKSTGLISNAGININNATTISVGTIVIHNSLRRCNDKKQACNQRRSGLA
jgi:hypothetical protein